MTLVLISRIWWVLKAPNLLETWCHGFISFYLVKGDAFWCIEKGKLPLLMFFVKFWLFFSRLLRTGWFSFHQRWWRRVYCSPTLYHKPFFWVLSFLQMLFLIIICLINYPPNWNRREKNIVQRFSHPCDLIDCQAKEKVVFLFLRGKKDRPLIQNAKI